MIDRFTGEPEPEPTIAICWKCGLLYDPRDTNTPAQFDYGKDAYVGLCEECEKSVEKDD